MPLGKQGGLLPQGLLCATLPASWGWGALCEPAAGEPTPAGLSPGRPGKGLGPSRPGPGSPPGLWLTRALFFLSRSYPPTLSLHLFCSFVCFFIDTKGEREKDRNTHRPSPACLPLGTKPTTRTCALTGSGTGGLLVHGVMLSPLSHSGWVTSLLKVTIIVQTKHLTIFYL